MSRRREDQSYEVSRRVQKAFGERLQAVRERKGGLQKVLAGHLGLSRTSISNIERGMHRVFLDQVYTAARALEVDVVDLLPSLSHIYPEQQVHTVSDDPLPDDVAAQAGRVAENVQRLVVARSSRTKRQSRQQNGDR